MTVANTEEHIEKEQDFARLAGIYFVQSGSIFKPFFGQRSILRH